MLTVHEENIIICTSMDQAATVYFETTCKVDT